MTLVNSDGDAITAVEQDDDIILKTKDTTYFDKLDSININNWQLDLPENDYEVNGDTLTIHKDALGIENPGQNTITLYADGYRAKHLSVYYTREIETGFSISGPGNIERGDQVRMEISGSEGDFVNNITTVTVHKPSGATSVIYPYGVGSYDDDYYRTSNTNVVTIVDNDGSVFDEDGTYTITIDAQYYNRLTTEPFTVTGELKSAPTAISAEKNSDNNYVVHFDESATSGWKNAITSITVNDNAYDAKDTISALNKNEYSWDNTYGTFDLTLQRNSFSEDENTIVIKATGYEDTAIKVTKDGALVGDSSTEPGGETQPAPAAPTATVDEAGNVTLAFDSVDSSWKSAISSVEVNGVGYSAFNDYIGTPGEKNYQWKIGAYGGQELYLDKTSFVTDENTVVIKADGYADLTVSVTIDGAEEPGETIKEVPEVTYQNYGYGTAYLYIDNGSMSSTDGANYVNAISRITVDGTEYSEAWGYIPSANQYVTSSSTPYIAFTDSTFSSEKDTVVVVEAEGYKTLTVTVHADGSITTSTADPGASDEEQPSDGKDAPAVKSSEKVYYSGNYILHFENNVDSNWETAIKSGKATVVVNDTTYAFKSSTLLVDDNNYAWTNYGDPQLTLDPTAFTKEKNTITISAEGYKDLTITIDKDGTLVK